MQPLTFSFRSTATYPARQPTSIHRIPQSAIIMSNQLLLIEQPPTISTRSKAKKARVAPNDKNQQFTPTPIVDFARDVFGQPIELDPTSSEIANEVVKAERFFTIEDDALAQDWTASTLWFNPPYGRGLIKPMIEKFIAELPNIEQAMVLVNSSTCSTWYQSLARNASAILHPDRRIQFWSAEGLPEDEVDRAEYQASPKGSNEYDQTLFYFGRRSDLFAIIGSEFGAVSIPAKRSSLVMQNQNRMTKTSALSLIEQAIQNYEQELQQIGEIAPRGAYVTEVSKGSKSVPVGRIPKERQQRRSKQIEAKTSVQELQQAIANREKYDRISKNLELLRSIE